MSTKPTKSDDDDEPEPEIEAAVDVFTLPPGADPSIDWGLTSHLHPDGSPRIIERRLDVPPELAGLRLDHFIKTQIPRLSRTRIQHVIETQLSRLAGTGSLKSSTKIAAGDRFVIRRPAKQEPPCPRTFTIVAEDARFIVIDKPALLPVHASAKYYFNTLTRVLGERFPDEPELQICHRLDRETSGCLVVARDREAAATLKGAFATKSKVRKEYVALVHGQPPWDAESVIDIPLRLALPGDPTRLPHVRMLPGPGGLPSITKVRVEQRHADTALVRCTLVTGRQHQIRAHLAAVGFPIVGDKLYTHGDDAFIRFCDEGLVPELAKLFVLPRQALHAARVTFPHPATAAQVTAEAPIPPDMR
ncbi:MAG: RluA family pseudouridine synthase [Myxococcota bacterium]|nr:RluA family pseudouridine synthase [Deltaproteobacteria bacterium]MDQ3335166.1 RluA family pseudouridine synthase [Myxococcota bacterium]